MQTSFGPNTKRFYSKKVGVGETFVHVLESIYTNLMAPRFGWTSIQKRCVVSFLSFQFDIFTRFSVLDFKLGLKFQLLKRAKTGPFWRLFHPFCSICTKGLILTTLLFNLWKLHKKAYFDKCIDNFVESAQEGLFCRDFFTFFRKCTRRLVLTTFLNILKNWKRQNEPYPFWRARALIWKMYREAYFEDFSAH